MKFYEFNGNNLKEGIDMRLMVSFLNEVSEANPGVTMDDLGFNCLVSWVSSAGPGTVKTTHSDGAESVVVLDKQNPSELLKFKKGDNVHLIPDKGQEFSIKVGNGEVNIEKGITSPPLSSDILPSDTDEIIKVKTWLSDGSVGISSKTISNVLYGIPQMDPSNYNGPQDPSDFSRCVNFFEMVPSALPRINELSSIKGWESIAPNWNELKNLYDEESANNAISAPKLYNRLKELRELGSSGRKIKF